MISEAKVHTAPSAEPVVLADIKTALNLSGSTHDTYLTSAGKAARKYLEDATRFSMTATQVIRQKFDTFPETIELY